MKNAQSPLNHIKAIFRKGLVAALMASLAVLLIIGSFKEDKGQKLKEDGIGLFTSIRIIANNEDISIVPSDRYGFEACVPSGGGLPRWGASDGRLTIDSSNLHRGY